MLWYTWLAVSPGPVRSASFKSFLKRAEPPPEMPAKTFVDLEKLFVLAESTALYYLMSQEAHALDKRGRSTYRQRRISSIASKVRPAYYRQYCVTLS